MNDNEEYKLNRIPYVLWLWIILIVCILLIFMGFIDNQKLHKVMEVASFLCICPSVYFSFKFANIKYNNKKERFLWNLPLVLIIVAGFITFFVFSWYWNFLPLIWDVLMVIIIFFIKKNLYMIDFTHQNWSE